MQYSSAAFSSNGKPVIRSKAGRIPVPTDEIYWSEQHINKGMTENDAYEINNVYTLNEHCKSSGQTWAYDDKSCEDRNNCIKKSIVVKDGSTCGNVATAWNGKIIEETTENSTIDHLSTATDSHLSTTEATTRGGQRPEPKEPEKDRDWRGIFRKIFGVVHAILGFLDQI